MRGFLATLLNDDAGLRTIGVPANNVFSAENVDTPLAKPFIVMRWGLRTPSFNRAPLTSNPLEVYAYDERGDYVRIDEILARVKTLFEGLVAHSTAPQASTGYISCIDWDGDSRDGYDDVWKAIYRNSNYRVIGNYVPG